MEDREFIDVKYVTNEEYINKITEALKNVENYKLKWFYNFIIKKLEGSI